MHRMGGMGTPKALECAELAPAVPPGSLLSSEASKERIDTPD